MRIIFSRKGFDSTYGGGASPVFPDGTMQSLPIPESGSGVRYADISTPHGNMLDVMHRLGMTHIKSGRKIALDANTEAHLDPDLYPQALKRHAQWRPVFGQCSAAQGHLSNAGVRAGDLFVFYGTYRRTENKNGLRFLGDPFHAVFAYMHVGDVVRVNGSTALPWCANHPHLVNRARSNNTLYFASDSASNLGLSSGCATLPYDERRVLSLPGSLSMWRLPRFFHPTVSGRAMTYHTPDRWSLDNRHAILQTKSPGQEYVVEASDDMIEWVTGILR